VYLLIYWEENIANIVVIYGKFTNIFNYKNREENQFKTEKQFPKQTDKNLKSNCFVINLKLKKIIRSTMP